MSDTRGSSKRADAGGPEPGDPGRAPESQTAAIALAVLLALGGLIGTISFAVDPGARDGLSAVVYGVTMLLCLAVALPVAVRRRVAQGQTLALVLLAQLLYVVVATCIDDPARYAGPLVLLFPVLVAAWVLAPWQLAVVLAATPLACVFALAGSYPDAVDLAVQVAISAGVLDGAVLAAYLLRRRVLALLAATSTLTRIDPLTGLHNRRYLAEQSVRVWRQARRDGTRVAALVLDLDHFKTLNDTHGHAAGDAVLRAVSRSLAATVRPADLLARTGGEELVVVGMVSDPDEAGRLAERLRVAVAAVRTEAEHAVTTSIGVALVRPVDGEDAASSLWRLIDRADAAMYEAKRSGRNRVATAPSPPPPQREDVRGNDVAGADVPAPPATDAA